MPSLRMLCYNIRGGRARDGERNLSRIGAMLDRYDIDIAVFQEMETRPSRRGTLHDIDLIAGQGRAHRHYAGSLADIHGWFGNLIVSRYPFLHTLVHNLETSPRYQPRTAADVLADTPLGPLRVIGTHLSLSFLERLREARRLMKMIDQVEQTEKNPLFLMGDINEWRGNVTLIRHLNDIMIPVPVGKTFPAFWPVFRLDRIWHDRPTLKVRAEVLRQKDVAILSDHLPVLVQVS